MSDVDPPVEVGADPLNHVNMSEIRMGVKPHQQFPQSIRDVVDVVQYEYIGSTLEQIFLTCVFADSMLFDRDVEFVAKEVGGGSDRVNGCCGIVVFSVSSKPDLDVLRILITSFHLLCLQSALRCVSLIDATRRQLTARPLELFSVSPPTMTRQSTGIATSINTGSAKTPHADSGGS